MRLRDTGMVLGSRDKGGGWLVFWRLLGDQEYLLRPRKPVMGFLPVVFVCEAGSVDGKGLGAVVLWQIPKGMRTEGLCVG